MSGTFGGRVGTFDGDTILRGPMGRLGGDAKGELCGAWEVVDEAEDRRCRTAPELSGAVVNKPD